MVEAISHINRRVLSNLFCRAWRQLHTHLRSEWFSGLSKSVVIGQSENFGFGFIRLKTAVTERNCNY